MRKIYIDGVQGDLWQLMNSSFQNAYSQVKWQGEASETFPINQGVRQGGILSADQYKRYNNELLNIIERANAGGRIGSISCPAPTCADDIAITAQTPSDLQLLLNTAHIYSCRERYELQPAKCMVLPFNVATPTHILDEIRPWSIGKSPIPVVSRATHIRIVCDQRTGEVESTLKENRVKARRALYSLLGTGMHGNNGLSAAASIHLFHTYVLPVLTYGLEILLPRKRDLRDAVTFFENTLRQLLSLPSNVAKSALYVLSGAIPLDAQIHRKAFGVLGSIARNKSSLEREIAQRQLLIQPYNGNSWFSQIHVLLIQYDLPTAASVIDSSPGKLQWNTAVKDKINKYCATHTHSVARLYPYLRRLNIEIYKPGQSHPLIKSVSSLPADIRRASSHLRLVTGTYLLQSKRAQYNQYQIDPTCPLCNSAPETLTHFLVECPSLSDTRQIPMNRVVALAQDTDTILPDEYSQLIMDPTLGTLQPTTSSGLDNIMRENRHLVACLEMERAQQLLALPPSKRKQTSRQSVKPRVIALRT
jgi:hypothetical protein